MDILMYKFKSRIINMLINYTWTHAICAWQ